MTARYVVINVITNSGTNPFTKKMHSIYGTAYHATRTKQNRTKLSARTHVFKSALLRPKICSR